jgi:predicted TIM-barrel fold metal-dependent hydrolase
MKALCIIISAFLTFITSFAQQTNKLGFDIYSFHNFCAHEHWGSFNSIGWTDEGFRADVVPGAVPGSPTSIWDIVIDPYLGGFMGNPDEKAKTAGYSSFKEWWNASPQAALEKFREIAAPHIMTGTFQCICRGVRFLYGVNLPDFKLTDWQKADAMIRKNYSEMFTWYQSAMAKVHFTELIRPVQPEFYLQNNTAPNAKQELSFTHTIMRIDPFLDNMWKNDNKRRDNLVKATGVDPVDAASWRRFLTFYFDLAEKNHTTGIKQLQAYSRNLDFKPRKDEEVKFRGDLTPEQITVFQDWVMNECCHLANERGWVHQVHVGTGNLPNSNPLPLANLADRYPKMKIVMIHCWPFLIESAYIAKHKANVYIDNCWVPVLSTAYFGNALDAYLNYVPYNKIMLSHDCTSIEMAVGSSLFTREILEQKLLAQKSLLKLSDDALKQVALDMLQNNAVRVYGIGKEEK